MRDGPCDFQPAVQQAAESHQLTLWLGNVSLTKAGETGPEALCPQRIWLQIVTKQTRSKETVDQGKKPSGLSLSPSLTLDQALNILEHPFSYI